MGHRAHQVFLKRVVLGIHVLQLSRVWNDLLPDCVALFLDCGQHRRRNAHGIVTDDRLDLVRVNAQVSGEILWPHDALSEYASPFLHCVSIPPLTRYQHEGAT